MSNTAQAVLKYETLPESEDYSPIRKGPVKLPCPTNPDLVFTVSLSGDLMGYVWNGYGENPFKVEFKKFFTTAESLDFQSWHFELARIRKLYEFAEVATNSIEKAIELMVGPRPAGIKLRVEKDYLNKTKTESMPIKGGEFIRLMPSSNHALFPKEIIEICESWEHGNGVAFLYGKPTKKNDQAEDNMLQLIAARDYFVRQKEVREQKNWHEIERSLNNAWDLVWTTKIASLLAPARDLVSLQYKSNLVAEEIKECLIDGETGYESIYSEGLARDISRLQSSMASELDGDSGSECKATVNPIVEKSLKAA
jgi:hypothetical protein